jgi:hypothetical protein
MDEWRRVENPRSGETFALVETSEENGGATVGDRDRGPAAGEARPRRHIRWRRPSSSSTA